MRTITKLFLLMMVVITIVPIVSADMTCSFINITTGPQGVPGADGIVPDLSEFCFINGTRAMTGNLSMGDWYINSLSSGDLENDAVNKSYVDGAVAGMSNYNATYDAKPDSNYNATYDGQSNYNATYDAKADSNYNASYITSTYNATYDAKPDTNYNASYWTGTNYNASYEGSSNYNASYVTLTNTSYVLTDGTRAMVANLSLGNYYINDLITGLLGSSAVNRSYVDSVASSYNATYDAKPSSTYNATYDAKADSNYNASYWTGTNYNASYEGASNYNASYITSTYNATYDAKPDSTFNATYDAKADTNYNASYWTGTNYNASYEGASSYNASYVETSNTSYVLTDGSRTMLGNLTFTGNWYINGLTDPDQDQDAATKKYVDDNAGSSYNASYITSTYNATYDAKPSSTYNATYDAQSNYNASYITTTNTSYVLTNNASYVLTNNGSYVQVTNASYVRNPIYGYTTLMAGSALITTTNPTVMNQWETALGNNYISLNFTDGGSEIAEWIIRFPRDWNSTANVVFTPVWTASSGAGTVNWTIAGKLFPNDAAMNTALANISFSTDTLITAGDIHVADDAAAAPITSVGTGGDTAIIKVSRNSAGDTLTGTAELIGLDIKFVRSLA
jgi:hypothetical protein